MLLHISTQNFDLTDKIKKLVDSKLSLKLDRLINTLDPELQFANLHIEQLVQGYLVKFDMTIPPKHHIFAQSQNQILTTALTKLKERVEKQLLRFKRPSP